MSDVEKDDIDSGERKTKEAAQAPSALFACCFFGLAFGLLDANIGGLRIFASHSNFRYTLLGLSLLTALCLVFAAALRLALAAANRIRPFKANAAFAGISTFLLCFAALALLGDFAWEIMPVEGDGIEALDAISANVGVLFKFAFAAIIAAVPAVFSFKMAGKNANPNQPLFPRLSAVPLLLGIFFLGIWIWKCHKIWILTRPLWINLIGAAMLIALCFSCIYFARIARRCVIWLAFAVAFLPIVAFPLFTSIRPKLPAKENATKHSIPHTILISIDALRADYLSCYNPEAQPTPHIDRFAEDSLLFERAISPAPWTAPAMASMMTGLSPTTHQDTTFSASLSLEFKTLAEHMKENGYITGRIGDNWFLDDSHHFNQGFSYNDWYVKNQFETSSIGSSLAQKLFPNAFATTITTAQLADRTIDWIEHYADSDFFFWLHTFDPHAPYTPSPEFAPKGAPPPGMSARIEQSEIDNVYFGLVARTLSEKQWIRELYNAEVREVDFHIGRIFDALKEIGIYDEALIVVTSDHGDEFWEHNGFQHRHTLYEELIHVPLIVKLPNSAKTGRIEHLASTMDIVPTLLDLCGIKYPNRQIEAQSLAPLFGSNGKGFNERPVFSSGTWVFENKHSVTTPRKKFIKIEEKPDELYNLEIDPDEQNNIIDRKQESVTHYEELLEAHQTESLKTRASYGLQESPDETDAEVSEEILRDLKAIGYMK